MVTVASSPLTSVELTYALDSNVSINSQTLYFSNGLSLQSYDLLENCIDVAINKDNLLLLVDSIKLQDVLTTTGDEDLDFGDYVGSTTISISGGELVWDAEQGVLGAGDAILQTQDLYFIHPTMFTSVSALSGSEVLYFVEFSGEYVSIYDVFDQYLTYVPDSLTICLSAELSSDPQNYQHFRYILEDNNIVLFTAVPSLSGNQRTVYFNTTTNTLSTGPAVSTTNPITYQHVFTINGYVDSGINDYSALQTNWVVYNRDDQSVAINSDKSVTDLTRNFLISTPFKTLEDFNLDINVNSLKTHQTAEYGFVAKNDELENRTYTKLIAGVNQDTGYENLFLGFSVNTHETLFAKDKYTYFHFAPTSTAHSLSASTLVNAGAIAGHTPWQSDKVFKKQGGYQQYSNWGDASSENGVFFCSWLSASDNPDVEPVWMDRFYNSVYVGVSATSLQSQLLTSVSDDLIQNAENPVIWDSPTTLVFEPGGLYIYYHVGEVRNGEIVSSLQSSDLYLNVDEWGSEDDNIIVDSSGNEHNGIIEDFDFDTNNVQPSNYKNAAYDVNGTYGYIENIDDIFDTDELTLSFSVYVDDWRDVVGDQIVGNYYNGGLGVFNNNPILTPYITLYETISANYVYHLNTEFEVINNGRFALYENGIARAILRTGYTETYYVLDSNHNILTYDNENTLQAVVSLTDLVSSVSATQIDIDGDYNFHVFDSVSRTYYKVSTEGALLTSVNLTSVNCFALDLDDNPYFPDGVDVKGATINNDGDAYYITDSYLYRDETLIWQASSFETILCDADNNIWLTYDKNKIAKLDSFNALEFSITTPVTSNNTGHRTLAYYRELTPTGIEDFIFLFDSRTQYAYKISTDGEFINTTPVSGFTSDLGPLTSVPVYGARDSGFRFQRKYVMPDALTPGIQVKAYLREQYINGETQVVTMQTSTEEFYGTKHVAVTFSRITGKLKLYIDGKLIETESVDPLKYRISANANVLSLAIGTNSSKRNVLVADLRQPGYYTLDGIVGNLKIVQRELKPHEILALHRDTKEIAFQPLTWNMPVGNRNYIEEIERFFKHKLPGNKSQFFNIKLTGLSITDTDTRELIEESIKNVLSKINPPHATLYRIIWA